MAALAAAFLLHSSPWLAAPFGESHDGRNAAVWAMASRSIRDEGVAASRFGGRSEPGHAYADHPPLIIGETTLVELVAGERRVVTRSPAWIGSLVGLLLMCRLLLDAGLSRLAVGVGIVATFGSAMFFVYGSMLDTPVTCLPFALTFLILWQRARQGRGWHPAWLGVVSLFTVLAGWQSTTLVGVAVVVSLWAAVRRDFAWPQWRAIAMGASIGLCITLLWIRWVYGSLDPLIGNAQYRTTASFGGAIVDQLRYLDDLMPLAAPIGVVGLALGLRNHRLRPLLVLSVVPVVAYALVFRGGAAMHDYWNYGAVVPLALGAAALAQHVLDRTDPTTRGHAVVGLAGLAALCLIVTLSVPSAAEVVLRNSLGTARLAYIADGISAKQGPALAYVSGGGARSPWLDYETGRPGLALEDHDALRAFAARHPTFPVLVVLANRTDAARATLERGAIAVRGPYALVPARLAGQVPPSGRA
jgi:hypothetical protein